jgi:hypothetical protein
MSSSLIKICGTALIAVVFIACPNLMSTGGEPSTAPVSSITPSQDSKCPTISPEEMKSSMVQSTLQGTADWSGPEGLAKVVWTLSPEIWHLQDPVVITGKRLGGGTKAEFLRYDETYVRRANLVFQPPHTPTGYTASDTGERTEILADGGHVLYPVLDAGSLRPAPAASSWLTSHISWNTKVQRYGENYPQLPRNMVAQYLDCP